MSTWETPTEEPKKGGIEVSPGLIGGAIAALLLVIFIAQNNEKATIEFLFWSMDVALWFGLVLAAVLAVVAHRLIAWSLRRRRRRND